MSSEKPVTEHIIDTHLLLKHQKGQAKTARIPIPVVQTEKLPKPEWIRVKLPTGNTQFNQVKQILRERNLFSVCEEATCPNIAECFGKGTATFMIMGQQCTRRCPFCDVGHGRPEPLDLDEPRKLAEAIAALKLKYVVITSVDRDDLLDGGAEHFVNCIQSIRCLSPHTKIEILTPDFRGRMDRALDILFRAPPDVMNHNLETVPRLYKAVRPGSNYEHSLNLLLKFKERFPDIPTKSGLMLGLGETNEEIIAVMEDMRRYQVDMITIGQYLQPTTHHLPVTRYVPPEEFKFLGDQATALGFVNAASGPMVRSSYHADVQAGHTPTEQFKI